MEDNFIGTVAFGVVVAPRHRLVIDFTGHHFSKNIRQNTKWLEAHRSTTVIRLVNKLSG